MGWLAVILLLLFGQLGWALAFALLLIIWS